MPHAAEKGIRFLILECRQGLADSVLGPALRVRFLGILEEPLVSRDQVRSECDQVEVAYEIGGFGHDEIVLRGKRLPQVLGAGFLWLLSQRVERGDLLIESLFARHEESLLVGSAAVPAAVEPASRPRSQAGR